MTTHEQSVLRQVSYHTLHVSVSNRLFLCVSCMMRSEGVERTQFFLESHQKHRGRRIRAKTYHANTQYRAYRREESTKNCIHYFTQQRILAFQNVQCKIQPSQMRKTLFHMHSRSPNDYKIRMMINTRQKNQKPQILL